MDCATCMPECWYGKLDENNSPPENRAGSKAEWIMIHETMLGWRIWTDG